MLLWLVVYTIKTETRALWREKQDLCSENSRKYELFAAFMQASAGYATVNAFF